MKTGNEIIRELVDAWKKSPPHATSYKEEGLIQQAEQYLATSGWLPISEAPKDGTRILLYSPKYKECFVGFWAVCLDDNDATWVIMRIDGNIIVCRDADHFQYLPQPPKDKK